MATLTLEEKRFQVQELGRDETGQEILVDGTPFRVEIARESPEDPTKLLLRVGAKVLKVEVETKNGDYVLHLNDASLAATLEFAESTVEKKETGPQGPIVITSPMAGRISLLKVSPGSPVKTGQAIFVLVAMKMENEIASPKKGVLKEIYVQPGALVKAGDRLALVD